MFYDFNVCYASKAVTLYRVDFLMKEKELRNALRLKVASMNFVGGYCIITLGAETCKSSSHRPPFLMPRKHQPFTCSTTLQGPYPYQQMKIRSQPVANITKKHGGMQHPRPVVPTKSGHSKSDRR